MTLFTRAVAVDDEKTRAKTKAGQGKPIRFLASSSGLKRDGLDLDPQRFFFDNFARNPVFLRFHDYWTAPIGRVTTEVTDRGLEVDVVFDPGDEVAVDFERKYREGYMHAVSIGWDFVKRMRDGDGNITEDETQAVEHVEGYDLLDVSAVAVPGDPDALIERSRRAMRFLYGDEGPEIVLGKDDHEALSKMVRDAVKESEESLTTAVLEALAKEAAAQEGPGQRGDGDESDLDLVYAVDPQYFAGEVAWAIEQIRIGKFAGNDPDGKRAGAVLSAANLADLREALSKIEAVIARAEKVAEGDGGDSGDGGGAGDGSGDSGAGADAQQSGRSFSWLDEINKILPDKV